jgi:sodium/pantothenate symporter
LKSKTPLGFVSTPGEWGWAGLISFALITSLGVWAMPQLIIRFYSIKSSKLFRMGTIVVTIATASAIIPYLCGAASKLILNPSEVTTPDLAIPLLTHHVLPDWGSAIFMAGVIAAGMSTFAGVLSVISGSGVRDIKKGGLKKEMPEESEIKLSRIISLFVGGISVLIALKPPSLILTMSVFAWAVIASTNFWPLIFGLYWKRANAAGTVASMVAGVVSALIWSVLKNPGNIHAYFIGTIVGLLVMVSVTLLTGRSKRIART